MGVGTAACSSVNKQCGGRGLRECRGRCLQGNSCWEAGLVLNAIVDE